MHLGQAGEFAFVTVGLAMALNLIAVPVGQFMLIVASLSMVLTPIVMHLAKKVGAALSEAEASARFSPETVGAETAELEDHVIIAGFGRVGQTVAKLLSEQKIPFVALDLNPQRIQACRKRGLPVFYGDARHANVLKRVGADQASAIVMTLDEPMAASQTITNIRSHWPELSIYARARDMATSGDLSERGATHVVPETVESSLQLAAQLLSGLGFPAHTVEELIDQVRQRDYAPIRPVINAPPDSGAPPEFKHEEKT